MHVLVRVDARDDRFAFHFRSPRSAACSAPGSPRHCTDGSATIQLACPIVRAHAPIRSWQDSGTRMPGRDRSDLRTAEEASAGQWVIVPAFSIRVALRRGNRAPLPRPAVPASPRTIISAGRCVGATWRGRPVLILPHTSGFSHRCGRSTVKTIRLTRLSRLIIPRFRNNL